MAYTRRAIRRAEDCAAAATEGAADADVADEDAAAAATRRLSPAAADAPAGALARGLVEDMLRRGAPSGDANSRSGGASGLAACFSVSDNDTPKVRLCIDARSTRRHDMAVASHAAETSGLP